VKVMSSNFQTFYQENPGLIYHNVYSKVRNHQEAEDLTSQIFLKVVRGLHLSGMLTSDTNG